VSPVPIEHYSTPRPQSSPHSHPNDESFMEEDSDELSERDKSLVETSAAEDEIKTSEPVIELKSEPPSVVESPIPEPESVPEKESKEESEIEPSSPQNELTAVEQETEESKASSPSVIHQNGDLDLEDGEIAPDTDVGPSGADSGVDDSESNETSGQEEKKTKEKIKYTREYLMNIRNQVDVTKVPGLDLIPDVIKEVGSGNQARGHHVREHFKLIEMSNITFPWYF
jgi:hypothetical protein